LIAILLTGGEAHDCPVAERLIDRVEPAERMLGDKAYDSEELREELDQRGTKPVIPNRSNRKRPFSFSKRLYRLRWRIEIDQSWRLSRIKVLVAGWGGRGWKARPRGRSGSYRPQLGDLSGICVHENGAAGCSLHRAAA
jgi:IS5 family transposase